MTDLVYGNGFGFMIGTGYGFSLTNSFRMLDKADKTPEDIGYSSSYPLGAAALTEAVEDYFQIEYGDPVFETLSDDPGFLAGAALGVYLGEKYFESANSKSELEEIYQENDLDEIWNDLEY
jgi:hypothetical protein